MKITCGTDIIEIERIKESIETLEDRILERVYTENEIKYCESKKRQKYQHYSARFAAKEAVFKAISDLIEYSKEDIWKNIVIKNYKCGKPFVKFNGALEFLNTDKKIESMDLSLSHIKDYAIANFVMLINE